MGEYWISALLQQFVYFFARLVVPMRPDICPASTAFHPPSVSLRETCQGSVWMMLHNRNHPTKFFQWGRENLTPPCKQSCWTAWLRLALSPQQPVPFHIGFDLLEALISSRNWLLAFVRLARRKSFADVASDPKARSRVSPLPPFPSLKGVEWAWDMADEYIPGWWIDESVSLLLPRCKRCESLGLLTKGEEKCREKRRDQRKQSNLKARMPTFLRSNNH